MRYAIRRYGRKWGLFIITASTGEDGELISTHKTIRAAETALQRHYNQANR